jgi:3-isopropylmalate dehydratase small subunit
MQAFTELTAKTALLPEADVDTDIIYPARFLLITAKDGLGRYAFYERRAAADGPEHKSFPLIQECAAGAQILIAGDNFGCGSSREHAVWALTDLGLRCIVSSSFGEIFYSNSFKNGLLPVVVTPEVLRELEAAHGRGESLSVSLIDRAVVFADGRRIAFEVEDWRRQALLNGWDEVLTILNTEAAAIDAFETAQKQSSPWLYSAG